MMLQNSLDSNPNDLVAMRFHEYTKSGNKMHILNLLDNAGNIELIAFDAYNKIDGKGNGPFAFKLKVQKTADEIKLSLVEAYTLNDAKNVKLKKSKITAEEIAQNADIFALPHSTIKDLVTAKSQVVLIAKISNLSVRTSKAGKEYAMVGLIDESGSAEIIAFSDMVARLGECKGDEIYGIVVNPARDATSKPNIKEILEKDQIAQYKPKKFSKEQTFTSAPVTKEPQIKQEIQINGETTLKLNIEALNHEIIMQIYNLAINNKGDKKLILEIKDGERKLTFNTDYAVPESFSDNIHSHIARML